MQIVPVLDLKAGHVVAARGGQRASYRPIETPLAPGSSDPIQVAHGLLRLYSFRAVYVADLDAIEGGQRNRAVLARLARAVAPVMLWIDDGSQCCEDIEAILEIDGAVPVLGSESAPSLEALAKVLRFAGQRGVLSLDFDAQGLRGPAGLADRPQLWPRTVIAMTLAAVGAQRGPDLARVGQLAGVARAGRQAAQSAGPLIYAAGGVRTTDDIKAVWRAGAAGALISSALHAQTIKAADLEEISGLF